MPDAPKPPRVIPNFAMDKPWTDPMDPEEAEGLAQTALLSGAAPTDAAITSLLGEFAGDYVRGLGKATG